MYIRIETGSGHPGHVLSRSSGSDPLYKISGSDPYFAIESRALVMVFGLEHGDELRVLDGDNESISPQDISQRVISGDFILKKKKNAKGSRAWDQFRVVFDPSNNSEVFGVACCCVCKVCILYKPGHIRVISGSDPDYYPGQWVIWVSDGDPVSTLEAVTEIWIEI